AAPPRSCGLAIDSSGGASGVRACVPGASVLVGCHAGCAPPLGRCEGDTVIQICPGDATTAPCSPAAALASDDDANQLQSTCPSAPPVSPPQTYCSAVAFTCPNDGRYTVWVGSYSSDNIATLCSIGVR